LLRDPHRKYLAVTTSVTAKEARLTVGASSFISELSQHSTHSTIETESTTL